jgi:hypothetical protein
VLPPGLAACLGQLALVSCVLRWAAGRLSSGCALPGTGVKLFYRQAELYLYGLVAHLLPESLNYTNDAFFDDVSCIGIRVLCGLLCTSCVHGVSGIAILVTNNMAARGKRIVLYLMENQVGSHLPPLLVVYFPFWVTHGPVRRCCW